MKIYLLEAQYMEYGTNELKVLRVATDTFVSYPSDTPANTAYDGDIATPLTFSRKVVEDGLRGGGGGGGYGTCEIINIEGKYDDFRRHGFDGRPLRFRVGDDAQDLAAARVLLTGTMIQPDFSESLVVLKVRDNNELFSKDLQTNVYAGNNVLPDGVEGTPSDLKGKTKPLCFGRCLNIAPPLVNTSKVVYQVHDGPVQDIEAVYSNGDPINLTKGTNYADQASFMAATVTAGTYITCNSIGMFRIGATTNTVITADVKGDASLTGYVDKPADVAVRMIKRSTGISDSIINAAAITALNSLASYEVGIYFSHGSSPIISSALDELLAGLRIWYTWSRPGIYSMGRFAKPTGLETPVVELGECEIPMEDFSVAPAFSFSDGNVPYRVNLSYQRNWRKHVPAEVTGNIKDTNVSRYSWLQEEYRVVKVEDTSVLTFHPLAAVFEYECCINDATAATAEATAVLDLYKSHLDRFTFKVKPKYVESVELGDCIRITLPRLSMRNGQNFIVIGINEDFTDDAVFLEVMG